MNDLAIVKKEIVDVVEQKITAFSKDGQLHLPENYSAQNAIKSAWLIIQELKDKNNALVLPRCSRPSIANALLDMVVQGLDPVKKQCYFIAYGASLTCQRSYFGDMALVKRKYRDKIDDIVYGTVHEGDQFTVEKQNGKIVAIDHKQDFGAADRPVVGAFCLCLTEDGRVFRAEVMTMAQIKQSWKQSRMKIVLDDGSIKADSVHGKFYTEMCQKTVIRRCLKPLLNSADDNDLMIEVMNRSEEIREDAFVAEEIAANENDTVIEVIPEKTEPQQAQQAHEKPQAKAETFMPDSLVPDPDEKEADDGSWVPSEAELAKIDANEKAEGYGDDYGVIDAEYDGQTNEGPDGPGF